MSQSKLQFTCIFSMHSRCHEPRKYWETNCGLQVWCKHLTTSFAIPIRHLIPVSQARHSRSSKEQLDEKGPTASLMCRVSDTHWPNYMQEHMAMVLIDTLGTLSNSKDTCQTVWSWLHPCRSAFTLGRRHLHQKREYQQCSLFQGNDDFKMHLSLKSYFE